MLHKDSDKEGSGAGPLIKRSPLKFISLTKQRVLNSLNAGFSVAGGYIFDHALWFILGSLLAVGICGIAFLFIEFETRADVLYALPASRARSDLAKLTKLYGTPPRISMVFALDRDNRNVLTKSSLKKVKRLDDYIQNELGAFDQDGRKLTFNDVCHRVSLPAVDFSSLEGQQGALDNVEVPADDTDHTPCNSMTPLDLYRNERQFGQPLATRNWPYVANIATNKIIKADLILTDPWISKSQSGTTRLFNATGFLFLYHTKADTPEELARSLAWEAALVKFVNTRIKPFAPTVDNKVLHGLPPTGSEFLNPRRLQSDDALSRGAHPDTFNDEDWWDFYMFVNAQRSWQDELARTTALDLKLIRDYLIAYSLVALYTVSVCKTSDLVRSKSIVGVIGSISALGGFIVGGGFCYWMGLKHTPTMHAAPFLVLGIGLDNTFVVLNFYSLAHMYTKQPKERCRMSLVDSGVALSVTTLTSIISFLVGAFGPYLAVRNFCLSTACGLLGGFVMNITFFFPCLCLEAIAEAEGRVCFLPLPFKRAKVALRPGDLDTPCHKSTHSKFAALKRPTSWPVEGDYVPTTEVTDGNRAAANTNRTDGTPPTAETPTNHCLASKTLRVDKGKDPFTTRHPLNGATRPNCYATLPYQPRRTFQSETPPTEPPFSSDLAPVMREVTCQMAALPISRNFQGGETDIFGCSNEAFNVDRTLQGRLSFGGTRGEMRLSTSHEPRRLASSNEQIPERLNSENEDDALFNGYDTNISFETRCSNYLRYALLGGRDLFETASIQWTMRSRSRELRRELKRRQIPYIIDDAIVKGSPDSLGTLMLSEETAAELTQSMGESTSSFADSEPPILMLPEKAIQTNPIPKNAQYTVFNQSIRKRGSALPRTEKELNLLTTPVKELSDDLLCPLHRLCLIAKEGVKEPSGNVGGFGRTLLLKTVCNSLSKAWIKWTMVLCILAYLATVLYGAIGYLSAGLDLEKLTPPDSYLREAFKLSRDKYQIFPYETNILVTAPNLRKLVDPHVAADAKKDLLKRYASNEYGDRNELVKEKPKSVWTFRKKSNQFETYSGTSQGYQDSVELQKYREALGEVPWWEPETLRGLLSLDKSIRSLKYTQDVLNGMLLFFQDAGMEIFEYADPEERRYRFYHNLYHWLKTGVIGRHLRPQFVFENDQTTGLPRLISFKMDVFNYNFLNSYDQSQYMIQIRQLLDSTAGSGSTKAHSHWAAFAHTHSPDSKEEDFLEVLPKQQSAGLKGSLDNAGQRFFSLPPVPGISQLPNMELLENTLLVHADAIDTQNYTLFQGAGQKKALLRLAQADGLESAPSGELNGLDVAGNADSMSGGSLKSQIAASKVDSKGGPALFSALPFMETFLFFESDVTILSATVWNMVTAFIAVIAVSSFLMRGFKTAVWVTVMIVLVDVGIFGFMGFWNIHLNILSMILLVLSIGFSVDYTVHVVHTFTHSVGTRLSDKASETLVLICNPVTHGAVSTMLGVVPIGLRSEFIMETFFKMTVLVVVFGYLNGVVFLPVVMALAGPRVDTTEKQSKALYKDVHSIFATLLKPSTDQERLKQMKS